MQAAGRIINWKYDSFSEVLMKIIIKALLVLSISVVFGGASAYAQAGTRVQAEIPFQFAIGDEVFPAGSYSMSVIRRSEVVHAVQLRDESGKLIYNTLAVQNGSTRDRDSKMVFSVLDDVRQLEKLTTADYAFIFARTRGDKRVASTGHVSIPASTTGPN